MGDQKRSWNYRAEDSTYNLSIADIAIILPGVYRGFDITLDNTMVLKLTHQDTGYVVTDIAGGTISDKRGAVVSKQGVVVTEDGTETLAIAVGGIKPRIDLIIMEHQYNQIAGGQQAIYSVVQGIASANPAVPTLPNPALQVVIGQLYVQANITALDDAGVVWTRDRKPIISGLPTNLALRDEDNIFTENNTFKKGVGFAFGGTVDISETALPDESPVLNVSITDDANYYIISDTEPFGLLHFIKSKDLGTAIPITFKAEVDFTLKHNLAPSAAEAALGYKKIFNQGGLDVNIKIGDYFTVVEYLDIWHVVNIWRKDGALDATQANTFPILGLDQKCFAFADNKLGTILQDILNSICSMTTVNRHAFRANKTALQSVGIAAPAVGEISAPVLFEDDTTSPFFDNGNDMYIDKYIVPVGGIKQKFIVENIVFTRILATDQTVGIFVDSGSGFVLAAGSNNGKSFTGAGSVENIPHISTDYLTLDEGDEVIVAYRVDAAGVQDNTFDPDMIFSNSVE